MRRFALAQFLVALGAAIAAPPPAAAGGFSAGVYADEAGTLSCISGVPGEGFRLYVWAWVPPSSGLAYLTLRFRLPANLDLGTRPTLHELVTRVIVTPFPGGTVEWNLLFAGCPTGWLLVMSQPCTIAQAGACLIEIVETESMARDCAFELHPLTVQSNLGVNDCAVSAVAKATWGALKGLYR